MMTDTPTGTGDDTPDRIWLSLTEPMFGGAQSLRKWDKRPFDGATEYVRAAPTGTGDLVKRLRDFAEGLSNEAALVAEEEGEGTEVQLSIEAHEALVAQSADALEAAERRLVTLEEAYIKASERQSDFDGTQTILLAAGSGARSEISDQTAALEAAERALQAILAEPYGCPFCDSGTLRNPSKGHDDDCGFALARHATGQRKGVGDE